eukprot:3583462-Prymnesium_polylepis.1
MALFLRSPCPADRRLKLRKSGELNRLELAAVSTTQTTPNQREHTMFFWPLPSVRPSVRFPSRSLKVNVLR